MSKNKCLKITLCSSLKFSQLKAFDLSWRHNVQYIPQPLNPSSIVSHIMTLFWMLAGLCVIGSVCYCYCACRHRLWSEASLTQDHCVMQIEWIVDRRARANWFGLGAGCDGWLVPTGNSWLVSCYPSPKVHNILPSTIQLVFNVLVLLMMVLNFRQQSHFFYLSSKVLPNKSHHCHSHSLPSHRVSVYIDTCWCGHPLAYSVPQLYRAMWWILMTFLCDGQ